MNLRLLLAPALVLGTSGAAAQGFAQPDLGAVAVDTSVLAGGPYVSRAEPGRLTLACLECADAPVLDLQVGRQDDGTEGRVRSGETTFAELEAICRAADPACRLEGLGVAPAVGWITIYAVGAQAAHTVVVLRDGDLLTIRSLATDPATARANADAAVATLVPQIVGD